ncbi:hypothetical protein FEM48_Zijuj10G0042700 [Ziziphus jujuba var. spinosa]|uniref:Vinorine synthase-like n=1 Tax=Ziziphus jujuba var. spinosa TaxID=714518 RepID=A0A978UL88_ZIZJJ|nr:hypothetical protein FEM48_Zijuj10G0042700 [Ziziphus jujuba var. spinosa]
MEVEVISKEIVKPSSPTPHHLRHYQLSFLDQLAPAVYNPLVLFYSFNKDSNPTITEISNHLKTSLSNVLTLFYPLAGRVRDNLFVDCSDDGIPYFETRVKSRLTDVITNPVPGEINKFLPFQPDEVAEFGLGVQLNIFQCGGIGIGVCISHKLGDAFSFFMFIKTWSAIAHGDQPDYIVRPEFVSATLFPPKDTTGFDSRMGITKKNIVSKRFVFDASAIETLRAKYEEKLGCRASRVEALSTFIWTRFVDSNKDEPGPKLYNMLHSVNLRPRFEPPLPENSFGNIFRIAVTAPTYLSSGEECYGLAREVREEIRKIDKEYVKKLQQYGDEHLDFMKKGGEKFMRDELMTFSFTSLCRFPVYEADFGWGKPMWVGSPALTFKNLVVFMDTKIGDGIEAYISLKEEHMAKLEGDQEFLTFVSPPLLLG